jgi:hypothetical protein
VKLGEGALKGHGFRVLAGTLKSCDCRQLA